MQWYYSKNGTQLGPTDHATLAAKLAAGEVSPSDLVWTEGMADWLPASQVPALIPAASGTPDRPLAPPVYQAAPLAKGQGKATATLVLGIIALVFGICGCYGMALTLPCGIIAIVFGNELKGALMENPQLSFDMGKVRTGMTMAWVGIGLSVLVTIALFTSARMWHVP